MLTLADLVTKADARRDVGAGDVLIGAASGSEVVLPRPTRGGAEQTMIFRHETISMMKAERAAQVEHLLGQVGLDSWVLVLRQKPESIWDEVTLGRASTSDLVLTDPAVSNLHAHFVLGSEEHPLTVQDLGSSNGTFLNRQPLHPHQPVPLQAGDCLRFGQTVSYFVPNGLLRELVRKLSDTAPQTI